MSATATASDAELLQRYDRGNSETAFSALVERYQGMVLGAAFRRTGNLELAREVAQEVFATLARKACLLTGRASLGGWLHQAAIYQAARIAQSEARRHARQEHFAKDAPTVATPVVGGSAVSDQLMLVDESLGFLSGADREVIVLHYFQDLSYPEMARILGVNEAAVRQRVSRALERLGKRLREQGITGNVVVLLLSAVAVQSTLAAPAGLAGAALASAAAGGGFSAYLLLAALLSPGATKTASVLVALAGLAALWHEESIRKLQLPETVQFLEPWEADTNLSYTSVASVSTETDLVLSEVPAAGQMQASPGDLAPQRQLPAVAYLQTGGRGNGGPSAMPASSRIAAPAASPVPAASGGKTVAPTVVSKGPPTAGGSGPKGSDSPGEQSGSPSPLEHIPDVLSEIPDYRLPGVLGELAELGGLPAVIAELRHVELLPREAAKLYGELLEDVLSLEPGKRPLLEGFLENHYEQLNEQGIAGIRPPEIAREKWRALREASVSDAVDGVQTILADVAPDPQVINEVLTLVEKTDPDADNSQPSTPLDTVAELVPVLPKVEAAVKLPLLP